MSLRWTVYIAAVLLASTPGTILGPMRVGAVAREILGLQQDVNLLTRSQKDIQTTLTQKGAVDKVLREQSTDTVSKLTGTMMAVQQALQDMEADSLFRLETISTQLQGASYNLREALTQTSRLNQHLTDMQNAVQRTDAKLSEDAPARKPFGRSRSIK